MKSTSIEAYEATLEYQPNNRWLILEILCNSRRWMTSNDVHIRFVELGKNSALSTVKARLRELEDFGWVTTRQLGAKTPYGNHAVSYSAMQSGMDVYEAGNVGRYINRAMSPILTDFIEQRADAFRVMKRDWEERAKAYLTNQARVVSFTVNGDE